jgi:hemolysin activation/secretion protein
VTKSNPKFLLKDLEIQSNNVSNGIGIHYKFLRQRRENLSFALNFNTTDYKVNTLNKTALTRDHVRALRFKINYDFIDRFFAHNSAELEFSNGIRGLGASKKGDLNLSRAKAIPNFAKTELRLQKLQPLTKKISIKLSTVGQYSANTLYSSEQFGYGGNLFGRAYDASEITGDKGVIAAMELIYHAPHDQGFFRKSPFMFYDVGKVWSANEKKNISCASAAGIGLRYNTQYGQTGEIVFAMPIKRKISHPIYGLSKGGPRILFLFAQQI